MILVSLLIFPLGGYICFAGEVEWQDIGRGNINVRTVLVDPDNSNENECTALAILPSSLYLGTKAGLFLSKDKGRGWYRESANLGKSHILAITYDIKEPNYIYVACQEGGV